MFLIKSKQGATVTNGGGGQSGISKGNGIFKIPVNGSGIFGNLIVVWQNFKRIYQGKKNVGIFSFFGTLTGKKFLNGNKRKGDIGVCFFELLQETDFLMLTKMVDYDVGVDDYHICWRFFCDDLSSSFLLFDCFFCQSGQFSLDQAPLVLIRISEKISDLFFLILREKSWRGWIKIP